MSDDTNLYTVTVECSISKTILLLVASISIWNLNPQSLVLHVSIKTFPYLNNSTGLM